MGKGSQSVGVRASNREPPWPGDPGPFSRSRPPQGRASEPEPHISNLTSSLRNFRNISPAGGAQARRALDSETHHATAGPSQERKKIFSLRDDPSEPDQLAPAADSDNQTISSREEAVKLKRRRMGSAPADLCPHEHQLLRPAAGVRRGGPPAQARQVYAHSHATWPCVSRSTTAHCWPGWLPAEHPGTPWGGPSFSCSSPRALARTVLHDLLAAAALLQR